MKKKILIIIFMLSFSILTVYALEINFNFDNTSLSFVENSKANSILNSFDSKYQLSSSIKKEDEKLEEEIKALSKKSTYLLLGKMNGEKESSEEFYERREDYFDLRYAPEVPKDENDFLGLDKNSKEYQDDLVSGIALPGMFLKMNEMGIVYNSYGDIRISKKDDLIISDVILPDVKLKEPSKENPVEYRLVDSNIMIHYYFKKLNDEYKLYYLYAEVKDDIEEYLTDISTYEQKGTMAIAPSYTSELSSIYNFEKTDNLSNEVLNSIYNNNAQNIVYLNGFYNTATVTNANGFFIANDLIVTTWSYLEKSLVNAQFITISDKDYKQYEIEGIVTINPKTNIAVIKVKNSGNTGVSIGDYSSVESEDPAIAISSINGTGLVIQKGIVLASDGYIQTSIPITQASQGSPLFNENGEVIGMISDDSTNYSTSMAVNSNILKEIQNLFKLQSNNGIKSISFEQLKEKYYYLKYNKEEVINNIPKNKWKKYSKIGDINNTIKLELVKANYKDNIMSLRYRNSLKEFISNMDMAAEFKDSLKKAGFKEVLNTSNKCIYESKKYQVVIIDELDYLIIVMVKL